jgi:hypothetical protein
MIETNLYRQDNWMVSFRVGIFMVDQKSTMEITMGPYA